MSNPIATAARTEPTEEQVAALEKIRKQVSWASASAKESDRSGVVLLTPNDAKAILALLPQRVAPSEEELHATLSGILFNYGDEDPDALGARLARHVLRAHASQPTVAEVRAQAVNGYAFDAVNGVGDFAGCHEPWQVMAVLRKEADRV